MNLTEQERETIIEVLYWYRQALRGKLEIKPKKEEEIKKLLEELYRLSFKIISIPCQK